MEDGVRERPGIPFIGRLRPRRACPGREARRETRRDGRGRCATEEAGDGDDKWVRSVSGGAGDALAGAGRRAGRGHLGRLGRARGEAGPKRSGVCWAERGKRRGVSGLG